MTTPGTTTPGTTTPGLTAPETLPSVYPILRYKDAPKAMEFLTEAFGFTEDARHTDDDGNIVHALLAWGTGVMMLAASVDGDSLFDMSPNCLYLHVEDPDAHHDRAKAAGAEIVMDLVDQDYGSREYAARDFEGNVWCFGTYRPGPGVSGH